MKLSLRVAFFILILVILVACRSSSTPTQDVPVTVEIPVSPTSFSFILSDSPATLTPTPSATPLPPTATPVTAAETLPGLPGQDQSIKINTQNANKLTLLDIWGAGIPERIGFSRNGQLIGIQTTRQKLAFVGATYLPYTLDEEEWEQAFPPSKLSIIPINLQTGQYELHQNDSFLLAYQGFETPQLASPDDNYFVYLIDKYRLQLWDLTKLESFELNATTCLSGIRSIAFSPDSTLLAVGCGGPEETMLFSTITGSLTQIISVKGVTSVVGLAISPDNSRLAVMDISGEIHLYALPGGGQALVLSDLISPWPRGLLAFRPDGNGLIAATDKGQAIAWDISDPEAGVPYYILLGPAPDGPLAFAPDSSILAAAAWNRLVLVNPANGEFTTVPAMKAPTASTIPLLSGTTITETGGVAGRIDYLSFAPDGRFLAAQIPPWHIQLWTAPDYTPIRLLELSCCGLGFSPDSRRMAVGGETSVSLLEVPGWQQVGSLDVSDQLVDLSFLPNGTGLVASSAQALEVYNLTSQTQRATLPQGWTGRIALSPDGKYLAAESPDDVRLYRTSDWKLIGGFPILGSELDALVFSPDSTLLAFSPQSGQIAVYNVENGTPLALLESPFKDQVFSAFSSNRLVITASVAGLAFSPDGSLLVSSNPTGVLLVWGIP